MMRNALGWWWHTPEDLLDKIDPAFLARDTRVVVGALETLLTEAVLPLDYAQHATALLRELDGMGEFAAPLVAAANAVRALPRAEPARANRALMRASRALVPLDYTTGDRFGHDAALPQLPWPSLDPLRALARAAPEMRPFALVEARRARNRMLHALRTAEEALRG